MPVYANATAQPYPADPRAMQAMLANQLLQPVRFLDQIEQIYAAGGAIFVEVGPRNVLTNLVTRILGDRPHIAVALNPSRQGDSDRQLREAAVQLRVAGVPMHGIDPYQREAALAPTRKRRGPTIRLNGSNYVSERTRADYADAIASAPASSEPMINEEAQIMTTPPESTLLSTPEHRNGIKPMDQTAAPAAPATPAELMAQLQAQQREILQVHQQFLTYQHEYVGLLLQLPQSAAVNHEGGLAALHQIQAETLRIHQQFLTQQGDYAAGLLQLIQQQMGVGAATLTPSSSPAAAGEGGISLPKAKEAPAPIFTPRPAAAAPVPVMMPTPLFAPAPAAAAPAPLFAAPPVAHAPVPAPAPIFVPPALAAAAASAPVPAPAPTAPAPQAGVSKELTEGLLAVVSEKTGYPRETLELGMDMETDLGVDSIKRVDILGTMQTRFTLPRLDPEELAELRTLAQIVAHLQRAAGGAGAALAAPVAAPMPASAPTSVAAPTFAPPPAPMPAPAPTAPAPQAGVSKELTEGLLA
ncbi:MAG: hypothetical protein HGA65_20125, partial [Oscillochloris sp.]|nr:hypothetical protein [Oscillochloris sp.]